MEGKNYREAADLSLDRDKWQEKVIRDKEGMLLRRRGYGPGVRCASAAPQLSPAKLTAASLSNFSQSNFSVTTSLLRIQLGAQGFLLIA